MLKNNFSGIFRYTGLFFLFLFGVYGCSSVPEVTSSHNNNEIVVDGKQGDWGNTFTSVKNENVAVAFKNDDENLYICFITSDNRKIVKVLSTGLTVWLYPSDSKDVIGIQYPVRKSSEDFRSVVNENGEGMEPSDINGRIQKLLKVQNELIIVDENNIGVFSSSPDVEKGFRAKIGYNMNQLVYELKIPLTKNKEFTQFVFKANPQDNIRVKFETGKLQNKGSDNNQQGSPRGNGGEGMGGGRRGRGGNSGGMGGNRKEGGAGNNGPLEYEFKVKLTSL
jgi:uncharacterized membrane protein YgcG